MPASWFITEFYEMHVDSVGSLWCKGRLLGKVGSAFTCTSTPHGGKASTRLSMYDAMAHLGLIIVPLGYSDPSLFKAGMLYGASLFSESAARLPLPTIGRSCRFRDAA